MQLGDAVDPNMLCLKIICIHLELVQHFRNHLSEFAQHLVAKFCPTSKDLIIDIASNDGTLLKFFQSYGPRVLGIEPSNIAKIAEENGINTVNDFFNENVANNISEKSRSSKNYYYH